MKYKFLSLILAAAILVSGAASVFAEDQTPETTADENEITQTETQENETDSPEEPAPIYSDISESSWYYSTVMEAYEEGLMLGDSGLFRPDDTVSLDQVITLAARLYRNYYEKDLVFTEEKPWYQVYVDYALDKGIISSAYESYSEPVTRAEFIGILAHAMPEEAFPAINEIEDNQIPDVNLSDSYGEEIYLMYRAGILTGNDKYGDFDGSANVKRSEAAAVLIRMTDEQQRRQFELEKIVYPDLAAKTPVTADFFSDAAFLGNSFVQGLSLYTDISKTADFYCRQSLTVATIGSYADQLIQHSYSRVYIELGINEIYMNPSTLTSKYETTINKIKNALPEAEIYIMAITPCTEAKNNLKGTITQSRIHSMNNALRTMAEENSCWYLDCCTPLENSKGFLKNELDGKVDGVHLNKAGYKEWEKILETYY